MAGIKETKDALIGVNEVAIFLVGQFKDGLQLADFSAVFEKLTNDPAFKMKMEEAYNGIGSVPSEIGDLDIAEGIELAMTQISYVPSFLSALKG